VTNISLDRLIALLGAGRDDLAALIGFFSRLPVPGSLTREPPDLADLPRAVALLPLAGLVIALPAAVVLALAGATALPGFVVATLAVATLALVTGFLHEDGLSDTADGLIGGANRDQRLEIMRDSRIGAFGAAALIFALLLRIGLLAAALERFGVLGAALILLATAAASRAGLVLFWLGLPAARNDGLSATIGQPGGRATLIALGIAAVVALAFAAGYAGFWPVVFGFLLVGVLLIVLSVVADIRIGGQTGDVLGAMQQLAEIGFLIGLLA
jgi:adenosylcobinamide-GDP ribazoletransferase